MKNFNKSKICLLFFILMDENKCPRRRLKFSLEEDNKLRALVEQYGDRSWTQIASLMEGRSVRQCRERWKHYLSASISGKVPFSDEENRIIMEKYFELGPKWTKIAKYINGRTDIQVKERVLKNLRLIMAKQPQIFTPQVQQKLLPQRQQRQKPPKPETQLILPENPQEILNVQLAPNNTEINVNKNVKNDENGVIRNYQHMYLDVSLDFYSQPTTNSIEDAQNAENVFYPYEF